MTKLDKNKMKLIEEFPDIDYKNIPKEILNEFYKDETHIIKKEMNTSFDGKLFSVRIPKEIASELNIKEGDAIYFELAKSKPNEQNVIKEAKIKVVSKNKGKENQDVAK
ncbi:AbrB/MazE/SpoVT family DNA-binding domain-containing protein [Methanolapillus africanus]